MFEFERTGDTVILRSAAVQWPWVVGDEWTDEPLMRGIERLFREIGTYLEFVAIARGD